MDKSIDLSHTEGLFDILKAMIRGITRHRYVSAGIQATLKWLFFRFRRVRELRFRAGKAVTVLGTNVTPEFWKILRLLGRGM